MQDAEKTAHIHVKQTVKGDFPPFIGENVGPELT